MECLQSNYEPEGRPFESVWAHHLLNQIQRVITPSEQCPVAHPMAGGRATTPLLIY
jgi:hypothetical protein